MKIEINQKDVDKLIKSRITEFNKKIRTLEAKLKSRDTKIHKLAKELELLKADQMGTSAEDAKRVSDLATCLVVELQRLNWVYTPEPAMCQDCGEEGAEYCHSCGSNYGLS